MSSGGANIDFYANASALLKEMDRLAKKQQESIENFDKIGKTARKSGNDAEKATAAAARELDRFAKATKDINRTPLERYADEMLRLNRALKAGKLDQETFNRAVGQAKTEFKKAEEAGHRAFGPPAAADLGVYTSRLLSIGVAAAALSRILGDVRAEADQLGQKQFSEASSFGSLAQLSNLTPADVDRLKGEAQKTFLEGGAMTQPEAVELQKILESGNIGEYRADMSRMQKSGLAQAKPMAEAGIMMAAGFGKAETGDFRTMMSKAFGAAMLGLGEADEIYQATAKVSQQAGRLGLSDEETMAAVSTASAVVGPNVAATQIEQLMVGIEKEGMELGYLQPGKSLREQVARLQQLEAEGNDIREMLGGRQEGVKGYGMLASPQGKAAMQINMQNIAQAEKENWFEQRTTLAENIPVNKAAITLRQRKAAYEVANEREGMYKNLADSIELDMKQDEKQKLGGGRLGSIAASAMGMGTFVERWLRGDEAFATTGQHPGMSAETLETARVLQEAAENLRSATAAPNYTNAARANQAASGGAVEAR